MLLYLLSDLARDAKLRKKFAIDPKSVGEKYGLTHRDLALLEGSHQEIVTRIGKDLVKVFVKRRGHGGGIVLLAWGQKSSTVSLNSIKAITPNTGPQVVASPDEEFSFELKGRNFGEKMEVAFASVSDVLAAPD